MDTGLEKGILAVGDMSTRGETLGLSTESEDTGKGLLEVAWLKWIDKTSHFAGIVGGILLPIAALMVFYEVCMRFFFGSPSTWVTEVSTYLVVAATFLSLAYVTKESAHIRVDFVTAKLSPRANEILEITNSFFALFFLVYLAWEGLKLAVDAYIMGELTSTIIRAPRFIFLGLVPLGAILFSLQYLRSLARLLKTVFQSKVERHWRSDAVGIVISGIFIVLVAMGSLWIKKSPPLGSAILFFSFLFCGTPVSIALALYGMFGFLFFFGSTAMMSQLALVAYGTLDSNIMAAVPLFVLAGSILLHGKVGPRLFGFASVWLRHFPGGLGIASVVFCGIFAAITGSSVATAATVSLVALPEMLSRGYERKFSLGLLAAGGTLGILFPPSLAMMIYGAMTEESIAQLFMAGVFPGLILTGMFIFYIILLNKFGKNKLPRSDAASFRERMGTTWSAAGGLVIPIIIIGGIYSGIFTPPEAASVAVTYSLFACGVIYKTMNRQVFVKMILGAIKTSSMVMFIVVGANICGQLTTMIQVAQQAIAYILSFQLPPWVIIVFINIFLIILGAPLEAISILVITLPLLHPLIVRLGFSPLWFGVIMVINMELALISPPEGINLFILQSMGKSNAKEISLAVIPYLIIMAIFLALISLFPIISTWLPSHVTY
jgi:C4-dicarboxylate transporter DctM subunit